MPINMIKFLRFEITTSGQFRRINGGRLPPVISICIIIIIMLIILQITTSQTTNCKQQQQHHQILGEKEQQHMNNFDIGLALQQVNNVTFKLPPIFDFNVYKQRFHKHYASAISELRRKALFVASCIRVLPKMTAFRMGILSYSLGLNWDSDLTREERRIRRSGINKPRRKSSNGNKRLQYSMKKPYYNDDDDDDDVLPHHKRGRSDSFNQESSGTSTTKKRKQMKSTVNNRKKSDDNEILSHLMKRFKQASELYATVVDHANLPRGVSTTSHYVEIASKQQTGTGIKLLSSTNVGIDVGKKSQYDYDRDEEQLDNNYDYELDPPDQQREKLRSNKRNNNMAMVDEIDWSKHECMLPAINQGLCGSCYAHATVSLIEFHLCRKKLLEPGERLSRELVLDCGPSYSDGMSGCQSGESNITLNMLSDMGMFWRQQDYENFYTATVIDNIDGQTMAEKENNNNKFVPYTDRLVEDRWIRDRCIFNMEPKLNHDLGGDIEDWIASQSNGHSVKGDDDDHHHKYRVIKASLSYKNIAKSSDFKRRLRYGPIGIQMYFPDETNDYIEGIFNDDKCLSARDDDSLHAMIIVGYGHSNGLDYFIIRNTWGSDWGINGNMKIATSVIDRCPAYSCSFGYYIVDNARPKDQFVDIWQMLKAADELKQQSDTWKENSDDEKDEIIKHQMLTMLSSLNLYDITLAERIEAGTYLTSQSLQHR